MDVVLYLNVVLVLVLDVVADAVVCLYVHGRDAPRFVACVYVQAHDSDYVSV